MTASVCNYCRGKINMDTDSDDTGYYCSVACFEKHLREKARKKKQLIGSAIALVSLLCIGFLFFSLKQTRAPQTALHSEAVVQSQRPEIIGDAQFTAKIDETLRLLKKYNYPQYNLLVQFGWPIQFSSASKGNLAATVEQGKIIIFKTLTEDSVRYRPEQLAGIIVHQSTHALALKQGDKELKPADYEKMAMENEIATYKLVSAPPWMLEEALARLNMPATYTIVPGDNLWIIAQKIYGNGNKGKQLVAANKKILGSGSLVIGQKIRIPRGLEQN